MHQSADSSSTTVDYAHKPAKAGWGYSKQYASNWERIFGGKGKGTQQQAGGGDKDDSRDNANAAPQGQ